ncbi:MAG TPA: hypothetical protein VKH15_12950 [Candidatus Acidoferrum sp.]|nr:hypothetical protein [Candidatus Acidoferrum sp.]
MKTRILIVLALVVLVAAFAYTSSAPAAPNTTSAAAVPVPQPNAAAATPAEPHPEIHEALAALRRAREHMDHAAHDFGGHKVEALRATDEAIRQLEICLKFDK